ncbi:hypothetical protein F4861DRAFT_544032 [Xylaria intraflava]|nr:hypothetical protein F4861DRAFT_544032 [Xylaria intraflava]
MSSGWKDVVKSGWQQGKEGSSSLKNQVKGLVNRDDGTSRHETHIAAPRSSLRDPASFGPPPKHVAAHKPVAAQTASSQATAAAPVTAGAEPPYHAQQPQHAEEPLAEPRPYQVDRTGLSTSHYPPPPARPSAHSPGPTATTTTTKAAAAAKSKVPPSLPPRLPTRSENSIRSPGSTNSQAVNRGYLNQGAINNLGAAGISVPGLGIGDHRTPSPHPTPGTRPPPRLTGSPAQAPGHSQVDDLQTRFGHMSASPFPSEGGGGTTGNTQQHLVPSAFGSKKPPPPPAPKKPAVFRMGENTDAPPPVPLATRPKFN